MNNTSSLVVLVTACLALNSCVVGDYPGGTYASGYGVYNTLPSNYVGDAYYHQNRYYYGGNYERGVFRSQGRQYTDRYYHGGQYYYGGRNEHHGGPPSHSNGPRNSGRGYGRR